jgi:hypothetical protein
MKKGFDKQQKLNGSRLMPEKVPVAMHQVASRKTSQREQMIWMAVCKESPDPETLNGITPHLYLQRCAVRMRGSQIFKQC